MYSSIKNTENYTEREIIRISRESWIHGNEINFCKNCQEDI